MNATSLDAAALAQIPVEPRALTLYYRHVHLPANGQPDPLRTSPTTPSRWATPAGTLYTATSEQAAWSEYCRQVGHLVAAADPTGGIGLTASSIRSVMSQELGDPVLRRALYSVRIEFTRVADLTTPAAQNALHAAGLDAGDFHADHYGRCPEIAHTGETLGWQACLAPSAAWRRDDGACVPVFAAGKPTLDAARVVRAAARPTIAIAYLTHYRVGARPRWLPTRGA